MENGPATRQHVIEFARKFRELVPLQIRPADETESGRKEWTRAIWRYLNDFCSKQNPRWHLFPESEPRLGRVKGEFLNDFAVFDSYRGCRIACESEWGGINDVSWAFDKLRAVKADIKLLIFQEKHLGTELSPAHLKVFREYLAPSHHHVPGREFYLFLQYEGDKAQTFLWEPACIGPLEVDSIHAEYIE